MGQVSDSSDCSVHSILCSGVLAAGVSDMGMVLDINVGDGQMSGELEGKWCRSKCNPLPLGLI